MTELLPVAGVFRADSSILVEARGDAAGDIVVLRLGDEISRTSAASRDADNTVDLGVLAPGGYGVEWIIDDAVVARTALDVHPDPAERLRYGFTVNFSQSANPAGLAELVRRMHLTGVQFYDWAYRHAGLLDGGEQYEDALGQPVLLAAVRASVAAVQDAGARAVGYAAVYAVGPDEWPEWKHDALLTATGEPYALGDFLFIVDPAAGDWLAHFTGELVDARDALGFDGFHLDQYGYPKTAVRADGVTVDVTESFTTLIESARAALPDATLVFNNVNDFPTWRTATLAQDAVYIEPWLPSVTLPSLATIVTRARTVGAGKPVVLAAYQHVYDSATTDEADRATALTMATLFSHGGTQLLVGETDRILVDPYYVRNHVTAPSTAAMLQRWYDFLVEHDELLLDPGIIDVTGSYADDYNDDVDIAFGSTPISTEAAPGTIWRRVTQSGTRLIVHAINLSGQSDLLWDAARAPFGAVGTGTLRLRTLAGRTPRVRVADPDRSPRLTNVVVRVDGTHAVAELPEFGAWQLLVIDLDRDAVDE